MRLFTAICLLITSISAHAVSPEQIAEEIRLYKKGDDHSPRHLTKQDLADPVIAKVFKSTVLINGSASGVYLGKHAGQHIVATNAHVVGASMEECESAPPVILFDSRIRTSDVKCLGVWTEVELALLSFRPYDMRAWDEFDDQPGEESFHAGDMALVGLGLEFSDSHNFRMGTPLVNVSYGIGGDESENRGNPTVVQAPRISMDHDCRIISRSRDFRFLLDPDTINPLDYSAWSAAHACDISHGSSGSGIFNRETGELLGLVWTGVWPEDGEQPLNSREIQQIQNKQDERVWSKLNYFVPAEKIRIYLRIEKLNTTDAGFKAVLGSILDDD